MKTWRIEYLSGHSVGRFKIVKADYVRVGSANGDLWFCNEVDREVREYIPKLIVAKGSYLSVERMEPKQEPIVVDFTKEVKRDLRDFAQNNKVEWI